MTTFAKRFAEAREKAGLTTEDVARELKISRQSVYYWENGSIPKAKRLEELASLLGVSAQWLVFGDSQQPTSFSHEDGSVTVPYLKNIEVSAGPGSFGEEYPIIRLVDLAEEWVREALPMVNYRSLAILAISGDSMEPTFKDKDTVLIDQSIDRITRDGLYVVTYDGFLFSKRFQPLPGAKLLMLSDNSLYQPVTIDTTAPDLNFRVIGRIVYSWHGEKR